MRYHILNLPVDRYKCITQRKCFIFREWEYDLNLGMVMGRNVN